MFEFPPASEILHHTVHFYRTKVRQFLCENQGETAKSSLFTAPPIPSPLPHPPQPGFTGWIKTSRNRFAVFPVRIFKSPPNDSLISDVSRSYAGSLPLQERVGVGGSLRTSKTSEIGLAKRASSNASQLQVTESKLSSEGGQTVPLRPKTQ